MKRLSVLSVLFGMSLPLVLVCSGRGQTTLQVPPLPSGPGPQRKVKVLDRYPEAPNVPAAFTIPVGPLGFSIPGNTYLFRRESLVSLDFVDEDRLLFTFHVSGLMKRDAGDADDDKRQIKAVILNIASGKVESQSEWIVPDRSRYLWMLRDGTFLLRTKVGLERGDGQLKLSPYLSFPGLLKWIQMDTGQQIIIANSVEAGTAGQTQGSALKTPVSNEKKAAGQSELVVRTVNRGSGEVMRVNRFPWTSQKTDWPVNSEGFLERSYQKNAEWLLKLNYFKGGDRDLVHLTSTCEPKYAFISETELLIARCDPEQGHVLTAMSTRGNQLWENKAATNTMWPLLVVSRNGSRVARESLLLKRSAEKYKRMLGASDLEGQMVRVLDQASGKVELEAPLTPILDGGGNVAISPSGGRVAILSGGAIQVFQLPSALHQND